MSVRWISQVWQSSPYKGERLLLHLALADFANDEGICWPSHSTLARKARCSNNWVRLSITQMVRDGLVEIVEPAGAGRGRVGVYRLIGRDQIGHTDDDQSEPIGHTLTTDRSHSDTSHTYLLNRHEPSHTRDDFERVWSVYPRKVSKGAAWRSWQRLADSPDMPSVETLIAAITHYATTITEMRYCAHLATWLSSQRWLDEITPMTTAPVEHDPRLDAARSHGAALARTRASETDLLESMTHRPPDEQAAALDLYREISAQYQSR